jgi:hypothetical protein
MLKFVGTSVKRLRPLNDFSFQGDPFGSIKDALTKGAFVDYLSPSTGGIRSGFVRAEKPLLLPVDFSNHTAMGGYVVFGFRIDEKKVPPKKLRALVEQYAEKWCKESGRERCPRRVQEEFKDLAEQELLPRCMPTTKIITVVWSFAQDNWVILSTGSEKQVTAVQKALFQAFGIRFVPDSEIPEDLMSKLSETYPFSL